MSYSSGAETPSKTYRLYQVFKYIIYCLLSYNILLFFQEDYTASAQLFRNGVGLTDVIEAYAVSIDTVSWVILLLLFELKTYIIPDEKLHGVTKWSLNGVQLLCYLFVFYAWYGYIIKLQLLLGATPFEIADTCRLIGTNFTYILSLDDYVAIDGRACQMLNEAALYQIKGTEIIGSQENLIQAQRLAWIDTINSTNWLFIVAIIEMDVYLQLRGKLNGKTLKFSNLIKPLLYLILLFNAVYWGINGEFLDFWDAFLWLIAFGCIEMNIFEWQQETA